MSEYKWGDPEGWDTFCYVEKGSEKLGFFQTYLELKNLQRQLEEARETEKKAFWSGFEIARMNPDFNDIQAHWGNHLKLKKHNEQLKEQGE
jgi:hypothetical protein